MTLHNLITSQNVNTSSVLLAVITFFVVLIKNHRRKRPNVLHRILGQVFAASAIPTGLVLVACAFDIKLIAQLTGLNVHIAAAGLSLLYLAFIKLWPVRPRLPRHRRPRPAPPPAGANAGQAAA